MLEQLYVCNEKVTTPHPQKKAATLQGSQHSAFVSINPATSQSATTLGHLFFSFLHPLLPFLYILLLFFQYILYHLCPSNPAAKKKQAIALYEQLDDAEAVAELAEAKSQLQQHRLRLKRRCTEAGHDAGEALRWERKMQTAKTRRRPSWTTERWKSEKLAEMDTWLFFHRWTLAV